MEFLAAVFASMEKKKNRMATLLVPPPIPRKEETMPNATPMASVTGRVWT